MQKTVYRGQTFEEERALYGLQNAVVEHCTVAGAQDGESFLKESGDLTVKDCRFELRYPLWHAENVRLFDCLMTKTCRAALWYDKKLSVKRCTLGGIKALRECKSIKLEDVAADSPEFGWRCGGVTLKHCDITSEYAFFESSRIRADGLTLTGKYSFQYTKHVHITGSRLQTKDAFWHAKDAVIENSVVGGEYLGWYSEGLTLIGCTITGTQPFCYCKNLRLIDCTMEGCDLAFEYSDVSADLKGTLLSVKNPRAGKICADGVGEVILADAKYPSSCAIVIREKTPKDAK